MMKFLMHNLDRLRRATRVRPSEWLLVVQMVGLLVRLTIWQRRLPLPVLIERFAAQPVDEPHPPLHRFVRLTTSLMRLVYRRDYCMKRSLLLFHFLTRWGYDPTVHFGVKIEGQNLKGHAWVELDGRPFAESTNPYTSFKTTYSYPS